jgi:hypothetical protein
LLPLELAVFRSGASKFETDVRESGGAAGCEEEGKEMTTSSESDVSTTTAPQETHTVKWLKVGVIAGASALVGGLAAAWWYRNTLKKLNQTSENPPNTQFGMQEDDSSYED